MIDTVNLRPCTDRPLKLRHEVKMGKGTNLIREWSQPNDGTVEWRLKDPQTGLFLKGSTVSRPWIQVSLPRLQYGNNFRILRCQEEIDLALGSLTGTLEGIFEEVPEMEFTRVDLGLQFWAPCASALSALHGAPHPEVRSEPTRYEVKSDAHSLRFQGRELVIAGYDKIGQMTKKRGATEIREAYGHMAGEVLRLEFQLRGKKLTRVLSNDDSYPTRLRFDESYEAYRKLALGFDRVSVQSFSSRMELMANAFAVMENSGITMADGRGPMSHLAEIVSSATMRRYRKAVRKYRLELQGIDWEQLLPPIWNPTNPHLVTDFQDLEDGSR